MRVDRAFRCPHDRSLTVKPVKPAVRDATMAAAAETSSECSRKRTAAKRGANDARQCESCLVESFGDVVDVWVQIEIHTATTAWAHGGASRYTASCPKQLQAARVMHPGTPPSV